jgi:hypothetical protein|nr:MAG TPA: hypothetical protein [Caudoviricetes sp.]
MKRESNFKSVKFFNGHQIVLFEDAFHQEFAIIDCDDTKLYASIADAIRVLKGQKPKFEII